MHVEVCEPLLWSKGWMECFKDTVPLSGKLPHLLYES